VKSRGTSVALRLDMGRPLILGALVSALLVFALYARIRAQEASEAGPSGGSGVVEGTSVDLGSRISGRLLRVVAVEGAEIHAGDLVAELDCAEPAARLAEADARISVAEAQVDAARAQVLVARRSRGAASVMTGVADAQAAVLTTHEVTAQRELERIGTLGEFAPPQRRDTAQDSLEALQHQREGAEAQRRASRAQASVAGAQGDAAAAAVVAAERTLAALAAVRTVAQIAVDECSVHATRDGTVDEVFYEAGEVVAPGAVLVRLVDLTSVTATFYLPNAELSAISGGQGAHVVADAWPGHTFDGTVQTVATEAEFTPRTVQTRSDRDRLVYPVEVRIANPERLLRPGMPVQVTLAGGPS
jgi:HlyD family secretion protein